MKILKNFCVHGRLIHFHKIALILILEDFFGSSLLEIILDELRLLKLAKNDNLTKTIPTNKANCS